MTNVIPEYHNHRKGEFILMAISIRAISYLRFDLTNIQRRYISSNFNKLLQTVGFGGSGFAIRFILGVDATKEEK